MVFCSLTVGAQNKNLVTGGCGICAAVCYAWKNFDRLRKHGISLILSIIY
jgi:hypothetical protein